MYNDFPRNHIKSELPLTIHGMIQQVVLVSMIISHVSCYSHFFFLHLLGKQWDRINIFHEMPWCGIPINRRNSMKSPEIPMKSQRDHHEISTLWWKILPNFFGTFPAPIFQDPHRFKLLHQGGHHFHLRPAMIMRLEWDFKGILMGSIPRVTQNDGIPARSSRFLRLQIPIAPICPKIPKLPLNRREPAWMSFSALGAGVANLCSKSLENSWDDHPCECGVRKI